MSFKPIAVLITILLIVAIVLLVMVTAASADTVSGHHVFLPIAAGGDGSGIFIPNEPTPTRTPAPTQVAELVWATQWDVYDHAVYGYDLPFYIPTAEEWCDEPDAWIVDVVRKGALLDICGRDWHAPATTRDWEDVLGDDGWTAVEVHIATLQIRSDGNQAITIQAGHPECVNIDDVTACSLSLETFAIGWYNQYWGANYDRPVFLPTPTPTPEAEGGPVGDPTPVQAAGTIPGT